MLVFLGVNAQTDYTSYTAMDHTSSTTDDITTTGWVTVGNGNSGTYNFTVSDVNGRSAIMVETYGATNAVHHKQQTISGLPTGVYQVKLYATSLNAWNGASLSTTREDVSYIYAVGGGAEIRTFIEAIKANVYSEAGYTTDNLPGPYTIDGVNVTDGTISFGIGSAVASQTNWLTVQIYSLTRTGDLQTMTLAEDVSSYEGTVPTAVYNALVSTVNANNGDYTDVDAYNAASSAITAAKANADALATPYAAYLEMVAAVEEIEGATDCYTDVNDAKSTLDAALSTAATTVEENANVTS